MELSNTSPIYLQIKDYFMSLIDKGALKEGDMLPSVRDTAHFFAVNPNTVVRAYLLLVKEGYISSLSKKGYFAKKKSNNKHLLLLDEIKRLLLIYDEKEIIDALKEVKKDD